MIDLHEGVLELFAEAQALASGATQSHETVGAWTQPLLSLAEIRNAEWSREVVRRRRLREGERLLRAMVEPLQARGPAPLARVVRWCPACGGRHETTHSADSWRRWHKQVCVALVREKLTTSNV